TDVFLRAAKLALHERPGLRFEHVGASDLHRDPGLDDELAKLVVGTSDVSITMRGRLPAEEVLPGWDVFVLASRAEGIPLGSWRGWGRGCRSSPPRWEAYPSRLRISRTASSSRPTIPPTWHRGWFDCTTMSICDEG